MADAADADADATFDADAPSGIEGEKQMKLAIFNWFWYKIVMNKSSPPLGMTLPWQIFGLNYF